ncbi:MAG: DUF3892 domain-containing protein [Thiohalocapsa sp.]
MPPRQHIPRYQVHCVGRSDRLNHDRRIRVIGGVNTDGARWQISEAAAIAGIEAGRWSLYISRAGRDIEIVVAVSKYGSKYLKTAVDEGPHPDGLLALPECR